MSKKKIYHKSGDTGGDYTWRTPRALFDLLDREFKFTTDAAALPENALSDHYFTPEIDALSQSWAGLRVFCNPPYGRVISNWVGKGFLEGTTAAEVVVMLIPAKPDTQYWHRYCKFGHVRFLKGRVTFDPPVGYTGKKHPAGFPSAVVIFAPRIVPKTVYWDWQAEAEKLAKRQAMTAAPRIGDRHYELIEKFSEDPNEF